MCLLILGTCYGLASNPYDRFRFVLGTSQPSNAAPNGDTGHKIRNTRAIHFVRVIVVFFGLNNNDAEQRKCRLIEDGT